MPREVKKPKILVFQALHIGTDLLKCTWTKMKCIDINCMLTKFSEGFKYIFIIKKKYYVYIYNTFITIDSLGDTNKR